MFNEIQKLKTWNKLKQEYSIHENKTFQFTQLLHAIANIIEKGRFHCQVQYLMPRNLIFSNL